MTMRDERGAALVEFVVVAGVLLTLLFGVLEMGRVSHVQLVMSAAAREGARRAAVDGGESARVLEGIRQQLVWGGVDPEKVLVEVSPRQAAYGSTIRVSLAYTYIFLPGPLARLAPGGIDLEAVIHSRSERLEGR